MARPRKSLNDPLWLKWDYLRKVHGYDADEWCNKLGISRQTWYRYSKSVDHAEVAMIRRMCELLHKPISEVVA